MIWHTQCIKIISPSKTAVNSA